MNNREETKIPRTGKTKSALTRRDLLKGGATLGAASALSSGCGSPKAVPEPLSETNLIGASELSGETLSPERIRGMRSIFEFNMKQLQLLREFDPDEEEPLTMFRA
ncbi:MAG: twin-arginine translocation signal domain-containing protein [Terriglobales bacterium]